jgi:hypothetical protein
MDAYEWGAAEVSYPDWKGTAEIDEKYTGDDSIYTLTGVDQDEWSIIGLEFGGGERGFSAPEIVVVPKGTDLDSDRIEARLIRLHEVEMFDVLSVLMNVMSMKFRTRRTESATIVITSHGDIPPQR